MDRFPVCKRSHGYFLIFREKNQAPTHVYKTLLKPGDKISLTLVAGSGNNHYEVINANQALEFALPGEFSFALYKYDVKN